MAKATRLRVTTVIEHKHEGLPRFACIPVDQVTPLGLAETTIIEGEINGVDIGRRRLKRWDDRGCKNDSRAIGPKPRQAAALQGVEIHRFSPTSSSLL
jgi:hypothetical protein